MQLVVHIFVHFLHGINEMLHATSLCTSEDPDYGHHAETLHTIFFVLLVKFQIMYKRMHGDGRSASSMVAAVRWKNKAYRILV